MQSKDQQILKSVPHQVKDLFAKQTLDPAPFRNLEHTQSVVSAAEKMATYYQLGKKDTLVLKAAAAFSDIGWNNDPDLSEFAAVELMKTILSKKQLSPELIERIAVLITSTKIPQNPSGVLEEISCDCLFIHYARKSFYRKYKLWYQMREVETEQNVAKTEWLKDLIDKLESHHYFSGYGQTYLEPRKKKNMLRLKKKLLQAEEKMEHPDKGIETMFRITSSNNQRLSDMADQKAHLLITVNSIILSAIISLVLRRLDKYAYLLYPTAFLLTVCLSAMTLAILTTRPSIPSGKFEKDELKAKKVNLLFFGNFYKMSLDEYLDGMLKVMDDNGFLYRTLITDVYGQGVVLGKKYGILRTAYSIFMFGLILAVLGFITAMLLHNK